VEKENFLSLVSRASRIAIGVALLSLWNLSAGFTAEPQNGNEAPGDQWFMSLGVGADLPSSNWLPAYQAGVGLGGDFSLGYEFDRTFSLALDLNDFYFTGSNPVGSLSDDELRILPTMRINLSEGGFRPYLTAGAGLDVQFQSAAGSARVPAYFDAALGAGLEFQTASNAWWFLEAKYNMIFVDGITGGDVPVLFGIRFGLGGEERAPVTVIEKSVPVTITIQDQTAPVTETKDVVLVLHDTIHGSDMTGFKSGDAEFRVRPNDLEVIQNMKDTLAADPRKRVVLEGYTDSVGTWDDNKTLSVNRVQWVWKFLVDHGIPKDKFLTATGYSENNPVATNGTKEGRADNRRVVIKIIIPQGEPK
jgi:outer membrane protein OmpA-like peptidoglycan-associated protein